MKPLRDYLKILLLPLLFLSLISPALAQSQETATITKIVDGDTFWVKLNGKRDALKLFNWLKYRMMT